MSFRDADSRTEMPGISSGAGGRNSQGPVACASSRSLPHLQQANRESPVAHSPLWAFFAGIVAACRPRNAHRELCCDALGDIHCIGGTLNYGCADLKTAANSAGGARLCDGATLIVEVTSQHACQKNCTFARCSPVPKLRLGNVSTEAPASCFLGIKWHPHV